MLKIHSATRACAFLLALSCLAACDNKAPQGAGNSSNATPNLAQAASPQAMREAQAAAARDALPKADKSTPDSNYDALNSGNQLMFVYLALADMPPDYSKIAANVSRDYAQATDEFRKHDLLAALTPKIDAGIAAAKSHRYFKVVIPNPIGKYSFEQKGFPLNSSLWESDSYRYYTDNSNYKLGFSNGEAFRYLRVADETVARAIEAQRVHYDTKLMVYGYFQSADIAKNVVSAEIVKVVLVDKQGNVLATQ
jgi:hypothetical protein